MDKEAYSLVVCGVLLKGQEVPESYYEMVSPVEEVLETFAIPKTAFCRFTLSGCSTIVDGVQLYSIARVANHIANVLTKRKQTMPEYVAYVLNQNRRTNGQANPETTAKIKLAKVIQAIHTITKDHPKARAVFERELQKIGVELPELETTKE